MDTTWFAKEEPRIVAFHRRIDPKLLDELASDPRVERIVAIPPGLASEDSYGRPSAARAREPATSRHPSREDWRRLRVADADEGAAGARVHRPRAVFTPANPDRAQGRGY
jgi:hypothetical protein